MKNIFTCLFAVLLAVLLMPAKAQSKNLKSDSLSRTWLFGVMKKGYKFKSWQYETQSVVNSAGKIYTDSTAIFLRRKEMSQLGVVLKAQQPRQTLYSDGFNVWEQKGDTLIEYAKDGLEFSPIRGGGWFARHSPVIAPRNLYFASLDTIVTMLASRTLEGGVSIRVIDQPEPDMPADTIVYTYSKDSLLRSIEERRHLKQGSLHEYTTFNGYRLGNEAEETVLSSLELAKQKLVTVKRSIKGETEASSKQQTEQFPSALAAWSGLDASSGQSFSLHKIKAKVVLVDLFYMSCPPCQLAQPYLKKMIAKYEGKSFQVLGLNSIDADRERWSALRSYLQAKQISYPVILLQGNRKEQMATMPAPYFAVYVNGRLAGQFAGFSEETMAEIDGLIAKSL